MGRLFPTSFFFIFFKKILKIKSLEASEEQQGRNPRCFFFGPAVAGVCTAPPRANISLPKALSEQRRRAEGCCRHRACHHGGEKDWEIVVTRSETLLSAPLAAPIALSALAVFRISVFLLFWRSALSFRAASRRGKLILEHRQPERGDPARLGQGRLMAKATSVGPGTPSGSDRGSGFAPTKHPASWAKAGQGKACWNVDIFFQSITEKQD